MRDGYIKFEGDKTSLAINKIHVTCLNMVLNPHFDERGAWIGSAQRYLDADWIAARGRYRISRTRIFRIDADEAPPFGGADELGRVFAKV